jgi:RES domain-containing protein
MPSDLISIEGEIPDPLEVARLTLDVLPPRWYLSRDESLHRLGDAWVRDSRTVALLVPSAAIRSEWNILLNPAHPDFGKLRIADPIPFEFDVRMYKS